MHHLIEPMRDVIGRALYEEPIPADAPQLRCWADLPEEKREPWRLDADRVIEALWREFFKHIQATSGPHPASAIAHSDIAEDRIARECEQATMALLRERARRADA